MPIKKLDAALRFLQRLYDDHQPNDYGSCNGNDHGSGFQEEGAEWPCYFHQSAADILGLPEVVYEDSRLPRVQLTSSPLVTAAWDREVQDQLKPVLSVDQQQLQAQYDLAHWKPDAD